MELSMNVKDQRRLFFDRLALAYRQGELVPFVGSGMSVNTSPGWRTLVEGLEAEAGLEPDNSEEGVGNLARRADRAVQALIYRRRLAAACRAVLNINEDVAVPPQTKALAKTYWPLVLTTNYDELYLHACCGGDPKVRVLGRSEEDCREVVRSLDMAVRRQLWAIQGHLGTSAKGDVSDREQLARQVVVGHHQYQRVVQEDRLFRRAFAEVFRRRSLLFLGSGLTESYFLDLFGEVLHGFGPGLRPHFALMRRADAPSADFLSTRLNVVLGTYERYEDLPRILEELHTWLRWPVLGPKGGALFEKSGAPRAHVYRYGKDGRGEVTLEASLLPIPPLPDGESVCVSLGREDRNRIYRGDLAHKVAAGGGAQLQEEGFGESVGDYVYRLGTHPVFGVAASPRDGAGHGQDRDLRAIRDATCELLEVAEKAGSQTVHLQLLSAGEVSHWPTIFSLMQMLSGIRAYGQKSRTPVAVFVHIVDEKVLIALAGGQVPVQEILSCDDLRFWVEVDKLDDAPSQRVLLLRSREASLETVATVVGIPSDARWEVRCSPEPLRGDEERWHSLTAERAATLDAFGVLPGSTLRFRYRAGACERRP